ncbi:hypothetical protein HUT06_34040 [Actinomadura sp. NAK00032]|uniref:DUF6895 family protein n=1 Tax=Actinomadura sp. NAK00032 TaxID=2742128 RepID=UPI00159183F8|nr:hypothetical protein [Actinomadura sp. NAK00032]QKW38418.1 hypothetical protein HUT06_34040 [Actinomadura sp. NAK00032]
MRREAAATAHRVLCAGLGWLHKTRTAMPGTEHLADGPASFQKALGEIALCASLVRREAVTGAEQTRQAGDLVEHAWARLGHGDLLYERALRNPLFTDPMESYAHFARAGLRHERLRDLLVHQCRLGIWQTGELVPHHRLAVANAMETLALPPDGLPQPHWASLTAATWLGQTPPPWAIDWATAYAVTHTVFHVTDWGRVPERMPAPVRDYLREWVPVWVRVWAEVEQWDLVAELLAADACLHEPACPAGDWALLAAAQQDDGMVPADARTSHHDDDERHLRSHRHATIAGVVAATLALSRALS